MLFIKIVRFHSFFFFIFLGIYLIIIFPHFVASLYLYKISYKIRKQTKKKQQQARIAHFVSFSLDFYTFMIVLANFLIYIYYTYNDFKNYLLTMCRDKPKHTKETHTGSSALLFIMSV